DGDDRAPFAEARAEVKVFLEAIAQAIEAFGDLFAREIGHGFGALVHLDAGDDALAAEQFDERHAAGGALADGFIEENHAADERAEAGRGEEQFAVGAAIVLGGGDIDGLETLLDGAEAFIGGEAAGGFFEVMRRHNGLPMEALYSSGALRQSGVHG